MADDNTIQNTQEVIDNTQALNDNTNARNLNADVQDRTSQAIDRSTTATDRSATAFNNLNNFIATSSDQLNKLTEYLDNVGVKLDETTKLTEGQRVAFGALSTLVLGASTAFDNLSNIDTRGLNTFSAQFSALGDRIKDSPLYKYGEALAAQSGKGGKEIASFATNFVKNIAASADQATKLENAVIQLSARTGTLGDLQRTSGANFQNINAVIAQQNSIIQQTANNFQLSSAQVAGFYTELGNVQGAIDAVIPGSGKLGENVSGLNAAILLAKGSGRDFTSIVNDMKSGFENYNLTTEESLQFTARISELSQKFKIPLEDVNKSLLNISNTFGIFGKEAEGAARLYNNYLGALQKTGISGPQAVRLVESMTQNLSNLSIAQKAFLSAQTGGPGGLLGGFQIEKELREGKIDQVFERVRQTLGKQFGKIVTLEEASQSQAAAQQLEKQVLLLTQGPLGQLIKSPQEAYRVLEGFRAKDEGRATQALDKDFLQKTMESGEDLTKQTNTILGGMARDLEQIRDQASFINLDTIQGILTAGTGAGAKTPDTAATAQLRSYLGDQMRRSITAGGAAAKNVQGIVEEGKVTASRDVRDTDALRSWKEISQIPKELTLAGSSVVSTISRYFDNLPKEQVDSAKARYEEELSRSREGILKNSANSEELTSNLVENQRQQDLFKAVFSKRVSPGGGDLGAQSPTFTVNEVQAPAARLGAQAATVANRANTTTIADLERQSPAVRQHTAERDAGKMGEITVHVEGYCINCRTKIDGKTQSYAVNPASRL